MTKMCVDCSIVKTFDKFSKNINNIDKLQNSCKECNRKYYLSRRTKVLKRREEYRKENKESINAWKRNYKKINKGKVNAENAKYRASRYQATPKWMTKEHLDKIKQFYMNCPEGYHVDHIIPLQNPNVCGLHVLWNLQYLPAIENIRKKNKI